MGYLVPSFLTAKIRMTSGFFPSLRHTHFITALAAFVFFQILSLRAEEAKKQLRGVTLYLNEDRSLPPPAKEAKKRNSPPPAKEEKKQSSPPPAKEEKKQGLLSKIFSGKDDKPTAPSLTEGKPVTTSIKPKSVPVTSKPKITAKSAVPSKSKTTAKTNTPQKPSETKPEPEKPATAKPAVAEQPKQPPAKPASKASPSVSVVKNEIKPPAENPWKVIDIGGREYVSIESIRDFYNPLYGFSGIKQQGTSVWLLSNTLILKATVGSHDLLMNNMKFILSFPLINHKDKALISNLDVVKLIDPILRPSHIQGAELFDTVVVDAGHGGYEPGARGIYGYEEEYTLKMALNLRDELMERGFKVVLTRSSDTFISLSGRVAIANQTPKSIFISLHFNSSGNGASGIETWALTPQNAAATMSRGGGFNFNGTTGNRQDSANIALASAVHGIVTRTIKTIDRGIKRAQWSVLTGCEKPGILLEGGFITNAAECRLIASESYQKVLCKAITDAVVNYRKALEPAVATSR